MQTAKEISANIHSTAIVSAGASVSTSAQIGAYSVIGDNVSIGDGVIIQSHVVIDGHTSIGSGTEIYSFASIGTPPQDLKYSGEKSTLKIGKNNVIREHVTMNTGTKNGGMKTSVGDNCLFMVGSHVAHDCIVGDNVILANNATLAGHVEVGDNAIIGGLAAVHQFVRIGKHSMIGGLSGVAADVAPFSSVTGDRAYLAGLNLVGLKRRGIERDAIHALRNAYKEIFESDTDTLADRAKAAGKEYKDFAEVQEILEFLLENNSRSFCMPK